MPKRLWELFPSLMMVERRWRICVIRTGINSTNSLKDSDRFFFLKGVLYGNKTKSLARKRKWWRLGTLETSRNWQNSPHYFYIIKPWGNKVGLAIIFQPNFAPQSGVTIREGRLKKEWGCSRKLIFSYPVQPLNKKGSAPKNGALPSLHWCWCRFSLEQDGGWFHRGG